MLFYINKLYNFYSAHYFIQFRYTNTVSHRNNSLAKNCREKVIGTRNKVPATWTPALFQEPGPGPDNIPPVPEEPGPGVRNIPPVPGSRSRPQDHPTCSRKQDPASGTSHRSHEAGSGLMSLSVHIAEVFTYLLVIYNYTLHIVS